MFELLGIWRTVLHVSEWTGLSLGALAGLAALAWFGWAIPAVRRFAIVGGLAVVAAYGGLIHGHSVGRAEVTAEWDDAKARAEQARKQRDAEIAAASAEKYAPIMADLQKQADDFQRQVQDYEQNPPAGRCELGTGPLRLRNPPRR